jgi:hypothetical protein
MATTLFTQNVVALIWDFDKTLIPGYMQGPLFRFYGIVEEDFWTEVNALSEEYRKRGYNVAGENAYLNHLLTYVRAGRMRGLNNSLLRKLGAEVRFCEGLPNFFDHLRHFVRDTPEFAKHGIRLEHYIVSTGLAEMIRGSAIAPFVDGVWGCEFIENPLPPGFQSQAELPVDHATEVSQIGMVLDNTAKTRAIFEINKGTNVNAAIDVNANIAPEDRRIPFQNMVYIADGPSDIPSFSVVKKSGGKAYAVYQQGSLEEFEQSDRLLQSGRVNGYGPARYEPDSSTALWLKLHLRRICERIAADRELALAQRVSKPPRHLSSRPQREAEEPRQPEQGALFSDEPE